MLLRTYEAFQNRVEYTHNADGSWKAEFHGAVHVAVGEPTLERCRSKILEALDQKLAEWIVRPIGVDSSRRRRSA